MINAPYPAQVTKYRVQRKKSARKNANYRDVLLTYDQAAALKECKRQQYHYPSTPARIVVETYIADWQLAKREVHK